MGFLKTDRDQPATVGLSHTLQSDYWVWPPIANERRGSFTPLTMGGQSVCQGLELCFAFLSFLAHRVLWSRSQLLSGSTSIWECLRIFDVFVDPSLIRSGCGQIIMEALAACSVCAVSAGTWRVWSSVRSLSRQQSP